MTPVYLRDAVRTPRGKARPDGALAQHSPAQLTALLVDALDARTGGAARRIDGIILGAVTQSGEQGGHIAHVAKLTAALPDAAFAHSLNNYCASGLSAIGQAAAMVGSGQADAVLAGGVESMSRVAFLSDKAAYYRDTSLAPRARFIPPVLAADRLAAAEGIDRAALDAAALTSQARAAATEGDAALQASRIAIGACTGEQCIRPATSADSLAAQSPAFAALQDDYAEALEGAHFPAVHTLAHAPPICDGAGLALVTTDAAAARARVVAFAESGGDPAASLTAGIAAMDKALARAGLPLAAIDRIEFMEAFGVTIAKFLRDARPDPERVNVTGGHLAKGHPMGASGAILLSTLLDALDAAEARLGLVVTTGAGGVGAAMIVERLPR